MSISLALSRSLEVRNGEFGSKKRRRVHTVRVVREKNSIYDLNHAQSSKKEELRACMTPFFRNFRTFESEPPSSLILSIVDNCDGTKIIGCIKITYAGCVRVLSASHPYEEGKTDAFSCVTAA